MAILLKILGRILPDHEVWAFGSRVHGRLLKPFSDIDLALPGDKPVSTDLLSELREQLSASDLPYSVDLVDLARVEHRFAAIIRREHEVIQTGSLAASP